MDFLSNLAGHHHREHPEGHQPPRVEYPWTTVWDAREQRWFFVNQQTGVRTFEYPGTPYQSAGYYQGGPPPNQYGGGQYGGGSQYGGGYGGQKDERAQHGGGGGGGHGLAYGALGAAGGLAAGALLMHEGHKVEEKWDEDKWRAEERFDRVEDRVEDFPEDAARWGGRKVHISLLFAPLHLHRRNF